MSAAAFAELHQLVLSAPSLQERLGAVEDGAEFTAEVLRVAGEAGLEVTAEDVALAMNLAKREWLERKLMQWG